MAQSSSSLAGETSTVTITFSEAVTDFVSGDFTVASGTLSAVSSSDGGVTWTATLTPTAGIIDAANLITLDNTAYTDLAGNTGTGSTDSNNYTINTVRPTATIVVADTALRIGETSAVTITFSEAVTGFSNADLTIASGALSTVSTSNGGVTWTATLTPTDNLADTTNVITLNNTGVINAAGNTGSGTTSSNNYAVDTVFPFTTSFTRQRPAESPTNANSLVFRATFSEAMAGVDAADFAVNGSTTATISGISAVSGSEYDVTVSGGDLEAFNGPVGLGYAGLVTITDAAGNVLTAVEPRIAETFQLDNILPGVSLNQTSDPANGITTITASLNKKWFDEVFIDLAFSGAAVRGVDYSSSGTSIVIPPGSRTGTITLTPIADGLDEPALPATVGLAVVTNGTPAPQTSVTATIFDLDPAPITAVLNGSVIEIDDVSGLATSIVVTRDAAAAQFVVSSRTGNVIATQFRFSVFSVYGIDADLGPLGDLFDASTAALPVTVSGGDGNDTLIGGARADNLDGGNGADILTGAGESDRLTGGEGADTVSELLDLNLTLSGTTTAATLAATLVNGPAQGLDTLASVELVSLRGGAGNNLIDVRSFVTAEIVTLVGGGGRDTIFGSAGRDSINLLGSGRDSIVAGAGDDTVTAGGGDDLIDGGPGNDLLRGQDGADLIVGGEGADSLEGGIGNDTLQGQQGKDTLLGGDGHDNLQGGAANDNLQGQNGDDALFGNDDNDLLTGGPGIDSFDGGSSTGTGDRLSEFVAGNESFVITASTLTLNSEPAESFVRIEGLGLTGVKNAGANRNNLFDARLATVPVTLNGGAGNDTLRGGSQADFLYGLDGDDQLSGHGGDDVLSGGAGVDVLDGGDGTDFILETADADFTVVGTRISSAVTGTDALPVSIERVALVGGTSANRIDASLATVAVVLIGGGGNDTLLGGSGNDTLSGGNRDGSGVAGADGIDSLDGGLGNDTYEADGPDTRVVAGGDVTLASVFTLLPSWIDQI